MNGLVFCECIIYVLMTEKKCLFWGEVLDYRSFIFENLK